LITSYSQRRHRILRNKDSEIGRWIDKEFPDILGLFIYFHLQTARFILACWRNQWAGRFEEILTFERHPCCSTRKELQEIVRRIRRPFGAKTKLGEIERQEYLQDRNLTDNSMEEFQRRSPRKIQIVVPR